MHTFFFKDPPKVTSLTLDGQEVGGDYLIYENQKVTVVCSFDKGNPSTFFRLLDKIGLEKKSTRYEGQISQSFAVQCEDDWPSVRCEGIGSEYNRSVSLLVRCKNTFPH